MEMTYLSIIGLLACNMVLDMILIWLSMKRLDKKGAEPNGSETKEKDQKLVSAKAAWESTKKPQLDNAIRKINESRKSGHMEAYICDQEKPHAETLDILLAAKYDIRVSYYDNQMMDPDWFTKVFWTNESSGKITYDKKETELALGYKRKKSGRNKGN